MMTRRPVVASPGRGRVKSPTNEETFIWDRIASGAGANCPMERWAPSARRLKPEFVPPEHVASNTPGVQVEKVSFYFHGRPWQRWRQ
jgi:hypothetical protein